MTGLVGDGTRIIPLDPRSTGPLTRRLEAARNSYDEARRKMLEHDLARFYRVAIFGSARFTTDSTEFTFVTELAKSLVESRNLDIVTGGGSGVMESAHFGVQQAIDGADANGNIIRSRNHATRIHLPFVEQAQKDYAHIHTIHPEFSTRLQEFLDKTRASYIAQGGIGTLLELAMIIQAKQVGHLENEYPILAHPMWKPIVDAWNQEMYESRVANGKVPLISEPDLNLIYFTNDIGEITMMISQSYDIWRSTIRDRVRYVRTKPRNKARAGLNQSSSVQSSNLP